MRPEIAFVTLFTLASAVAIATRRWRVPFTVALVLAGLALGLVPEFHAPHLTKDLVYTVFLPGLLFEAAFHLEFRSFWRNAVVILALAVPGLVTAVVVTAALLAPVANALASVQGFRFLDALVFAALLGATDPIAVTGLFKSIGAPRRLGVLVEGESLLNDGTSIVLFTLVLGLALGGQHGAAGAALDFAKIVGVGAGVGVAIGYLTSKVIQRVDDPMIEISLTTIAAYGSFGIAEQLHYSGVIATVCAGMLCGNYGARTGMSPTTRIAVETFWEYVAFALNSFVFLLIGLEVRVRDLLASWKPILAAYVAVTAGRALMIYAVSGVLRKTRGRIPWSWAGILTWGGLRGALSMVLALALPGGFPHRDLLVTMTFGVVVISILLQGLSIGPLVRRVVGGESSERLEYEKARGAMLASYAARRALEELKHERSFHPDVLQTLERECDERVHEAEKVVGEHHDAASAFRREELRSARRSLVLAEKERLLEARRQGLIGEAASDEVTRSLDDRLAEIGADDEPASAHEGSSSIR